jgi:hypothetical protein
VAGKGKQAYRRALRKHTIFIIVFGLPFILVGLFGGERSNVFLYCFAGAGAVIGGIAYLGVYTWFENDRAINVSTWT